MCGEEGWREGERTNAVWRTSPSSTWWAQPRCQSRFPLRNGGIEGIRFELSIELSIFRQGKAELERCLVENRAGGEFEWSNTKTRRSQLSFLPKHIHIYLYLSINHGTNRTKLTRSNQRCIRFPRNLVYFRGEFSEDALLSLFPVF